MKMKWLWTTWAYLAVVSIIALDLLFIGFSVVFLVPKLQKIKVDGWLVPFDEYEDSRTSWMFSFLGGLYWPWRKLMDWWALFLLLPAAGWGLYQWRVRSGKEPFMRLAVVGALGLGLVVLVVLWDWWALFFLLPAAGWGLFEWRVRGENKSLMRLSALGTIGLGLLVVVVLTAGSMVMPLLMLFPPVRQLARPFAIECIARIDASVSAIEKARAENDWEPMQENAHRASHALNDLVVAAGAIPRQRSLGKTTTVDELREQLKTANECLRDAEQAIREKDSDRLEAALREFRKYYEPVREAAKELEK